MKVEGIGVRVEGKGSRGEEGYSLFTVPYQNPFPLFSLVFALVAMSIHRKIFLKRGPNLLINSISYDTINLWVER